MAYLEKAESFTSLDSVAFSTPGTVGLCTVLHSSNPSKHQQVPEPGVETLACLPLCQKKKDLQLLQIHWTEPPARAIHTIIIHSKYFPVSD